jgi:hypothetical protein
LNHIHWFRIVLDEGLRRFHGLNHCYLEIALANYC